MSRREGDLYAIRPTPGICTGCGHLADVRPVGKRAERPEGDAEGGADDSGVQGRNC